MNKFTLGALAAILVGVITAFVVSANDDGEPKADKKTMTVTVINTSGDALGTASFFEGPVGVLMRLELEGMPPDGWHAMHLHEVGDCSDGAEGFKASGSHINPDGKAHGLLNPDGPDNADFPNLYVQPNGVVKAEFHNGRVSFRGKKGRPALLDKDGSALVIHANPDDHMSQPIGGAGPRIACGVLKAD